jgi:hypothetical protein
MSADLRQVLDVQASGWEQLLAGSPQVRRGPGMLERFILRAATVSGIGHGRMPKGMRKGELKACFENAALRSNPDGTYIYCEGFAMHERIAFPFLHAWLVNKAGQIIDPTLRKPNQYQYLGITIPHEQLWEELLMSGVYGVLDPGVGLNVEFMDAYSPPKNKV